MVRHSGRWEICALSPPLPAISVSITLSTFFALRPKAWNAGELSRSGMVASHAEDIGGPHCGAAHAVNASLADRAAARLPDLDQGIDLIAQAKSGGYWAIQCKYRTDKKRSLSWRGELATFTGLAFGVCKGITHALVAHQLRARTVQHRQTLLLEPLHRHERHAWSRHRLADRGGITRIRLATLDMGLDVLRRHQLHAVPELGNLTRPISALPQASMPTRHGASLAKNANTSLRLSFRATTTFALSIDAVDLEHLLCKVDPDGGNCCHGRPTLVIRLQRSLYGTSMPCEAPSTSSKRAVTWLSDFEVGPTLRHATMGAKCQGTKSLPR